MFENLQRLPADPILGLINLYREDPNPNRVDLGVGVYKDEQGRTPVLASIKQAEYHLLANQDSKAYLGAAGNPDFNRVMAELLFGEQSPVMADNRLAILQTPGGCGALRVGAELIKASHPNATIWVSDPTWGNHIPLLGNSGLAIRTYPYFDSRNNTLDLDGMLSALSEVKRGDLVLLHGCCHNPSGVDLAPEHWQAIADLALTRGFTPFIDIAYQGFGEGVVEDAYGLRLLAEQVPEVLFAASCSKNFGLYRERVGSVGLVAASSASATAVHSHLLAIVRGIYSMPPDHGAALVAGVLEDPELSRLWHSELADMRGRIQSLRQQFSAQMAQRLGDDAFGFVRDQRGMFSFLGLSEEQVSLLARDYSIYLLSSSRASIAGLNHRNIDYVCDAVKAVYAASAP